MLSWRECGILQTSATPSSECTHCCGAIVTRDCRLFLAFWITWLRSRGCIFLVLRSSRKKPLISLFEEKVCFLLGPGQPKLQHRSLQQHSDEGEAFAHPLQSRVSRHTVRTNRRHKPCRQSKHLHRCFPIGGKTCFPTSQTWFPLSYVNGVKTWHGTGIATTHPASVSWFENRCVFFRQTLCAGYLGPIQFQRVYATEISKRQWKCSFLRPGRQVGHYSVQQ